MLIKLYEELPHLVSEMFGGTVQTQTGSADANGASSIMNVVSMAVMPGAGLLSGMGAASEALKGAGNLVCSFVNTVMPMFKESAVECIKKFVQVVHAGMPLVKCFQIWTGLGECYSLIMPQLLTLFDLIKYNIKSMPDELSHGPSWVKTLYKVAFSAVRQVIFTFVPTSLPGMNRPLLSLEIARRKESPPR